MLIFNIILKIFMSINQFLYLIFIFELQFQFLCVIEIDKYKFVNTFYLKIYITLDYIIKICSNIKNFFKNSFFFF